MERKFAERFFPKNFGKITRRRAEALDGRLNGDLIASLLSLRFHGEPLYKSIDDFYTQEYAEALAAGTAPADLAKIERYRKPTEKEVNLLFSDVHAKEKVYEATGGQPAQ